MIIAVQKRKIFQYFLILKLFFNFSRRDFLVLRALHHIKCFSFFLTHLQRSIFKFSTTKSRARKRHEKILKEHERQKQLIQNTEKKTLIEIHRLRIKEMNIKG